MASPDLVVVGAGVYGLCVAAEAALLGLEVLVVERHPPTVLDNSSAGETRLSRLTTVEDPAYVTLARESQAYFAGLQDESPERLFDESGFAFVAEPGSMFQRHHSGSNVFAAACQIGEGAGIEFEALSGAELTARFPSLAVDRDSHVYFEPNAWTLFTESISERLLERCRARGVDFWFGFEVASVEETGGRVSIVAGDGTLLDARFAVIASGAGPVGRLPSAKVLPQPVVWINPTAPLSFPALVVTRPDRELLFGFAPTPEYPRAKFVLENTDWRRTDPESDAFAALRERVSLDAGLLVPSAGKADASQVCDYVVMPGSRMTVSTRGTTRVLVVNCCSGHGYKMAPAIAQRIASAVVAGEPARATMS
jgi:sarcosine oxidase